MLLLPQMTVNIGATAQPKDGKSTRTVAEIVGNAGSTSCVNFAPNGMVYEESDIQYLIGKGYTVDSAIQELSKTAKYNQVVKLAPNGKPYEQNDIDYPCQKVWLHIRSRFCRIVYG